VVVVDRSPTNVAVDSVTVRIYAIDLETYFRKMHLAGGVEGLDISLIDADKSFEFKVPKYADYQELESQIDVALPAPAPGGAMAVTVSSKTLTATTLSAQRFGHCGQKLAERGVRVRSEHADRAVAQGAAVDLNGKQVFAEGTTGDDGVFQKEFKELAAARMRVFAVAESHIASNIVGLQGVGVARV
jgi:hypothetical protein